MNIDLWTPLAAPNEHLALDSGTRDVCAIVLRDVRIDDSGTAIDVNFSVNNKTDEDITLQYAVCDAYGKSLEWQWQSPNNEYIALDDQEFMLAKSSGKTVDWKFKSGSTSGEPFMLRVRVDFKNYIYVPFARSANS